LAEANHGKNDGNIYTYNMGKPDSKLDLEHEPKSDQMSSLQPSSTNPIRIAPDSAIRRLELEQV
jgi:hypothetical protein